ncbi:MAG: ribonuclease P protein subunit [Saccharolobus sp.]|jgi:ribonuclease P protein subunit POP4|uniref:Ribonuclease P protein component 1 n=1 Tax=Saccharolobus caldissimus TaxID=1702097 RepID=A0AAQ4CPB9_9CREN|nr:MULTISPECIES: ribonuclease P protein subunit [Saccharolobus]MDT7860824.1 ribonuclease P protein subunit [Saccharolobus sp.]BDB97650.1 ribonuclease P [Saccharolobus caldissimus]
MRLDYIGAKIKILYHSDPSLILREGYIILETEKTFLIKIGDKNKIIRVLKANGIFEITFKGKSFIIAGYKLVGKPWKRIR